MLLSKRIGYACRAFSCLRCHCHTTAFFNITAHYSGLNATCPLRAMGSSMRAYLRRTWRRFRYTVRLCRADDTTTAALPALRAIAVVAHRLAYRYRLKVVSDGL